MIWIDIAIKLAPHKKIVLLKGIDDTRSSFQQGFAKQSSRIVPMLSN